MLPVLPGPPLSLVGLFLIWAGRGFHAHTFSGVGFAVLAGITILVTVLDLFAPAIGAKRYGATKAGLWGSILGMIAGMFVFPPFGVFVGTFVGALVGEFLAGQRGRKAVRASWGTFVGTMVGIVAKLAVSGVIAWFVFAETFA